MADMKEKLNLIELLFNDLLKTAKVHIEHKETYEKEVKKYRNGEYPCYPINWNCGNKNCGKTALKRKITYLRQELMNLERMLEDG